MSPKSNAKRTRIIDLAPDGFTAQINVQNNQLPQFRKRLLVVCDSEDMQQALIQQLQAAFSVHCVSDPIAALVRYQEGAVDFMLIVLEQTQPGLWVMLRSLEAKIDRMPVPVLLFVPGMEVGQMQKAYRHGVLFCCNRQLDAKDITFQLVSFANFQERYNQHLLNRAGLHDGMLRVAQTDHGLLEKLNTVIKDNYINPQLSVHWLANKLEISVSTLERKCLQLTGLRPKAYLSEFRLLQAYQQLAYENSSIQEASQRNGFANTSYFSVKFVARFGIKPSELIRKSRRIA